MSRWSLITIVAILMLGLNSTPARAQSVADLSVSMVASASAAAVGQTVTFQITATNRGPSDAETDIHELVPAGMSIVSINCGGPTSDGPYCEYRSVARWGTVTMIVVGMMLAGSTPMLTNKACVSSESAVDLHSANNCASVSVAVSAT